MTIHNCVESTAESHYLPSLATQRVICCPKVQYETSSSQKNLQDTLEDHLSMYHFHQAALLELARGEYAPDSQQWEYGAYLMGSKLLEQSEWLIEQLSELNHFKS